MEKKPNEKKNKLNGVEKRKSVKTRKKEQVSKKEKKKIFAAMGKKQKIAVGVIAIVAIAGISGGAVIYANIPKGGTFIFGVVYGPESIDPLEAWDAWSIPVIDQVAEGLLDLDLTSEDNDIIPNLAMSYSWSSDAKQITFSLRQGVTFHDGTAFDATAVKWNFDRIQSMLNVMVPGELWLFPDGSPIINQTVVVDAYTLRLELNDAYIPLLGLLSSWTAYMLSPTSTPADRFLEITEDLVGTGPFTLDSCEPLVEVKMSPNPNYWGGKPAIDELVFSVITDLDARNEAMLSGDISMIQALATSMIETFRNTQGITVQEGSPGTTIWYLGMNNNLIPLPMRKAISYALNYSYIINELLSGYAIRMRSPIPKGILYSNTEDFDVPDYDLQTARQALKDAGWPGTDGLTANDDISPGNEWEKLVTDGTPIATYNYTYPVEVDSPIFEGLLILLTDNLKQIGVEVEAAGMTFYELLYRGYEIFGLHRDMLQLYHMGWIPDYNDPSNFINPPFTNKAVASNMAQVDDMQVQQWMEEALTETDPVAREQLYYNIQESLIEEVYPWCWLYVPKIIDAYVSNLRGWQASSMKTAFKTVYFV